MSRKPFLADELSKLLKQEVDHATMSILDGRCSTIDHYKAEVQRRKFALLLLDKLNEMIKKYEDFDV